jgi:hypothetical protein
VARNHDNTGYCDELPDNPLYHSHQPLDDVEYSTVDEQRPNPSSTEKTEETEKASGDDTNDVYAKPNKTQNSHQSFVTNPTNTDSEEKPDPSGDVNGEVVYAQVNRETKM